MLHPGHHHDMKIYCKACRPLHGRNSDGVGLSIWKNKSPIFPIKNGNEDNFCTYDTPMEMGTNCEIEDPLGSYYSDQSQLELYFLRS